MKTTVVYWGSMGIVEKENGNYRDYRDYIGIIWGLHRAYTGLI